MGEGAQPVERGPAIARLPFFDPEVVAACNRVPLRVGLRRQFIDARLTGSPFPVVDKPVLCPLMADHAPAELLYRRKTTTPAMREQFELVAERTLLALLRVWGSLLLERLDEPVRSKVLVELEGALAAGVAIGNNWRRGWMVMTLVHLALLARLMDDPQADLDAQLEAIGHDEPVGPPRHDTP